MVIIRGTRKVLDRVGSPSEPDTASTTMLGDWFATVLFWRPQLAMFVNATTLLPVFMPLAPAATVLERFPDTLAVVLRAHGIAGCIIGRELARDRRAAPRQDQQPQRRRRDERVRPPRRLAPQRDHRSTT